MFLDWHSFACWWIHLHNFICYFRTKIFLFTFYRKVKPLKLRSNKEKWKIENFSCFFFTVISSWSSKLFILKEFEITPIAKRPFLLITFSLFPSLFYFNLFFFLLYYFIASYILFVTGYFRRKNKLGSRLWVYKRLFPVMHRWLRISSHVENQWFLHYIHSKGRRDGSRRLSCCWFLGRLSHGNCFLMTSFWPFCKRACTLITHKRYQPIEGYEWIKSVRLIITWPFVIS